MPPISSSLTVRPRSSINLDLALTLSTVALLIIGVLFVYSSGVNPQGQQLSDEYLKQAIWASLGIVFMILLAFLDYRLLHDLSLGLYLIGVVLLILTLAFGRVVNNSRSWLGLFGLGIQPSEFMKVIFILFLSRFYVERMHEIQRLRVFLTAGVIMVIPVLLILRQPDLGTALVFLPIFLGISFVAGVPITYLIFATGVGGLAVILGVLPLYFERILNQPSFLVPLLTAFPIQVSVIAFLLVVIALSTIGVYALKRPGYKKILYIATILLLGYVGAIEFRLFLKEYQIMRLITFLDPQVDPRGAGWNIIQSLNAIGSGGLWGKGYLRGPQSQLRYIPMQNTDFIFSILAEEWGFIGGVFLLALYAIILWRATLTVTRSPDSFGALTAAGILSLFGFHLILNVGMNIGIMPITGIPLIFVSYGGSSVIMGSLAIGLLLSIQRKRFLF